MTRERLVRVRDEGELGVGMIVVFKGCPRCPDAHRFMLLRYCADPETNYGTCDLAPGWSIAPMLSCSPLSPDKTRVDITCAIAEGCLYRVLDGLSSTPSHTEQERDVERRERV